MAVVIVLIELIYHDAASVPKRFTYILSKGIKAKGCSPHPGILLPCTAYPILHSPLSALLW